jgi:hypothetical protein
MAGNAGGYLAGTLSEAFPHGYRLGMSADTLPGKDGTARTLSSLSARSKAWAISAPIWADIGVEFFRAVEGDDQAGTVEVAGDVLVVHGTSPGRLPR